MLRPSCNQSRGSVLVRHERLSDVVDISPISKSYSGLGDNRTFACFLQHGRPASTARRSFGDLSKAFNKKPSGPCVVPQVPLADQPSRFTRAGCCTRDRVIWSQPCSTIPQPYGLCHEIWMTSRGEPRLWSIGLQTPIRGEGSRNWRENG